MDGIKYLALDLHIASITYVLMSVAGKVLAQGSIPVGTYELRKLLKSIRGYLKVTFEEGTLAQWAYDVVKPLAKEVLVCNPRHNHYLEEGNKGDKIDAFKLAELYRSGMLKAVYHGGGESRALKELMALYMGLVSDSTRVMSRLKAVYRSLGIHTGRRAVFYEKNRPEWLNKLTHQQKRCRADFLHRQLDQLMIMRRESKKEMLKAARQQAGYRVLMSIPGLGPVRVAILLAIIVTPHRFATKRQIWKYAGLSVLTRTSSDYKMINGQAVRVRRKTDTRGLTPDFNHLMKYVLKGAAIEAIRREPFKSFYRGRIEEGMRPEMARLVVARKIGTLIIHLWKEEALFDGKVMLGLTA